jgi:hypothetical protein
MEEYEERKKDAKRELKIALDFDNGGIVVVGDKKSAVGAVEDESRSRLMDFITVQPSHEPIEANKSENYGGNRLSQTQEEILDIIRSKLGSGSTDRKKQETVSIFSFLDDDMNSAL